MSEKKKVILDVDTGSDDALAIMTAILSNKLDVVAICTTLGNKEIDATTNNTLMVVDLLKSKVPVYQGCCQYMTKTLCPSKFTPVHKRFAYVDGKKIGFHPDRFELDEPTTKVQELDAPSFYVDYLRNASEPITIIPLGPITNLGIALTMDPTIVKNIKEIILMGGGAITGNISASAEANAWHDPEALEKVMKCGAKITMVPTEAIEASCFNKPRIDSFKELGDPVSTFAYKLMWQRMVCGNQVSPDRPHDISSICDTTCVLACIDDSVLRKVAWTHVDVSLPDGPANGQTVCDRRYFTEEKNCFVAYDADPDKCYEMMYSYFANNSHKLKEGEKKNA